MLAAVDWTAIGIIGTLLVSLLGSLFGLYQARRADKSATTTKTIELGVKDLIDQYQERQEELKGDLADCNVKIVALEAEVARLREELRAAQLEHEHLEAEIRRLQREAGEM